jgi:hypothetical protein
MPAPAVRISRVAMACSFLGTWTAQVQQACGDRNNDNKGAGEHRLLDHHELLQGQRGEEVEGRVQDQATATLPPDARKNRVNSGDSAMLPTR